MERVNCFRTILKREEDKVGKTRPLSYNVPLWVSESDLPPCISFKVASNLSQEASSLNCSCLKRQAIWLAMETRPSYPEPHYHSKAGVIEGNSLFVKGIRLSRQGSALGVVFHQRSAESHCPESIPWRHSGKDHGSSIDLRSPVEQAVSANNSVVEKAPNWAEADGYDRNFQLGVEDEGLISEKLKSW